MEESIAQFDKLFAAAEFDYKHLPKETFLLKDLQKNLGKDPKNIMKWLRRNISLRNYRGLLKGAKGVLFDRGGNLLDVSVFAATLSQLAGHEVRIVWGNVPKESNSLVAQSINSYNEGIDTNVTNSFSYILDNKEALSGISEILSMDENSIENFFQTKKDKFSNLITNAKNQSEKLFAELDDVIKSLPVKNKKEVVDSDYFWFETYNKKDKSWHSYEVLPGLKDKVVLSEIKSFELSKLPIALAHKLTFKVLVHVERNNRVETKKVFEKQFLPYQDGLSSFNLSFAPSSQGQKIDHLSLDDKGLATIKSQLIANKDWVPVIGYRGKDFFQSGFNIEGEVIKNPFEIGSKVKTQANKATNMLGGLLSTNTSNSKGILQSVSLEYTVNTYGARKKVISRNIYTRSNDNENKEAINRALAFAKDSDTLIATSFVPNNYNSYVFASTLLKNRLAFKYLTNSLKKKVSMPDIERKLLKLIPKLHSTPYILYEFASQRHGLYGELEANIDRINLVSHTKELKHFEKGRLVVKDSIDVIDNTVSFQNNQNIKQHILAGILDTALEAKLLKDGKVRNSFTFLLNELTKDSLVVLKNRKDVQSLSSKFSLQSKAYLERAVKNSQWIVLNPESPSESWFRIDSRTFQTIGMSNVDGYIMGITAAETVIKINQIKMVIKTFMFFGKLIACGRSEGAGAALCLLCQVTGYIVSMAGAMATGVAGAGLGLGGEGLGAACFAGSLAT